MIAETIANALGGRKTGTGWTARCPAHDDGTPSLSIREASGTVLVYCHAGCTQERVIAELRDRGLWNEDGSKFYSRARAGVILERKPDQRRSEPALAIWRSALPSPGTPVETYLRSRGIYLPPPDALRFHPGLKHPTGGIWPAMVALVTRGPDAAPLAVHRTFLARDGAGKAAIEPQKMMLGPCRGSAVRLAAPNDLLLVGEGIETCLTAMQASGYSAWAALSTSGLRSLDLPTNIRDLIVVADGDGAGKAAARDCALRWKREGRRVRIARPPQGMDFNDLLKPGTPSFTECAR
jgi:putative DNA primase/helicase